MSQLCTECAEGEEKQEKGEMKDALQPGISPLRLESRACAGVVVGVVAGRADRDSLDEASLDRLVEGAPCRVRRPAFVSGETTAVLEAPKTRCSAERDGQEGDGCLSESHCGPLSVFQGGDQQSWVGLPVSRQLLPLIGISERRRGRGVSCTTGDSDEGTRC